MHILATSTHDQRTKLGGCFQNAEHHVSSSLVHLQRSYNKHELSFKSAPLSPQMPEWFKTQAKLKMKLTKTLINIGVMLQLSEAGGDWFCLGPLNA